MNKKKQNIGAWQKWMAEYNRAKEKNQMNGREIVAEIKNSK